MLKLKVNDIFESVQGEGLDIGKRAVFVRFSGCNLNCSWCDTDFEEVKWEVTGLELADLVSEYSSTKYIVLTGGEPLIQCTEELIAFCQEMINRRCRIAVETNGTVSPKRFLRRKGTGLFSLMSISPKMASAKIGSFKASSVSEWSRLTRVCCKFVIQSQSDMDEAIDFLSEFSFADNMVVVFQPEASTMPDGYEAMIRYYDTATNGVDLGYDTRFLIQMHKAVDIK